MSICFLFLFEWRDQFIHTLFPPKLGPTKNEAVQRSRSFYRSDRNQSKHKFNLFWLIYFRLSNAICITQPNHSWIGSVTLKKGLLILSLFQQKTTENYKKEPATQKKHADPRDNNGDDLMHFDLGIGGNCNAIRLNEIFFFDIKHIFILNCQKISCVWVVCE